MPPIYSLRRVQREGLVYTNGERLVNIGAYGAWAKGATVSFVINNRWNPPRSGPPLQPEEIASIEAALREYAMHNHVTAAITVDFGAA